MARHCFALVLGTDEVEQMTLVARVAMVRIGVVDAGQGILKGGFWLRWCADGATVPTLFDEVQFLFEDFQNVATIFSHSSHLQFS